MQRVTAAGDGGGGKRKAEQRCCSNTLRTGFKLKLSELHIMKCVDSKAKCPVNEWTHQFFITLIFSLSLHIVHIVQIRKKTAQKKIFHCFTFSEDPSGRALSLCCSVETDEIPASRVTLLSAEPKVSLNCKNTKPL